MAGDNRTPDKIIGEIKYAQDQTERTKEQQREKEDVRSNPKRDPSKKKTGEFWYGGCVPLEACGKGAKAIGVTLPGSILLSAD
jgi:hypothetical protein